MRWKDDKEFGHLQGDQFDEVSCWGVSRGGVEFDTDMFSQWWQKQRQLLQVPIVDKAGDNFSKADSFGSEISVQLAVPLL